MKVKQLNESNERLFSDDSMMYSPFLHCPPTCQQEMIMQNGMEFYLIDSVIDNDPVQSNILPWRSVLNEVEEPMLSYQGNDTINSPSVIEQKEEHHRQPIMHLRSKLDTREMRRKECMDYYIELDRVSCASISRSYCAYLMKQVAKANDGYDDPMSIDVLSDACHHLTNESKTDIHLLENQRKCLCRVISWVAKSDF